MKLNRKRIDARIPGRLLEKLKIVATFKETTATAIIEGALEKGLTWHLKQIAAELGKDPKQFTWKELAEINGQQNESQAQNLARPVSNEDQENISEEELRRKVDKVLDELDAQLKKR